MGFQTTGNGYNNYCEVGLRISGFVPISTEAAIYITNKLVTSVTITVTEKSTVAFLGTSDGVMKKVSFFKIDKTYLFFVCHVLPPKWYCGSILRFFISMQCPFVNFYKHYLRL